MAKRDIKRIIDNVEIPNQHDMTVSELLELAGEPELDAIWDGFKFGFVLGTRYQKRQDKPGGEGACTEWQKI